MNIYEFNLLTLEQKCQVIDKNGMYIAGRNDGGYAFNLYSIYSFYAELCFNFNDDCLEKVITFQDSKLLEPYIDEIILNI